MATTTIDRINKLIAERQGLYRQADNGHRGEPATQHRIWEINVELQQLWDRRRRELAGHRTGIDRLVDRVYERTYGPRFEDTVAPPRVGEPEQDKVPVAA